MDGGKVDRQAGSSPRQMKFVPATRKIVVSTVPGPEIRTHKIFKVAGVIKAPMILSNLTMHMTLTNLMKILLIDMKDNMMITKVVTHSMLIKGVVTPMLVKDIMMLNEAITHILKSASIVPTEVMITKKNTRSTDEVR